MAHAATNSLHDGTDWMELIRAEYLEMPGLNPTITQAERLWNLESSTLREIFAALVDSHFLRCTSSGKYVRADAR